MIRFLTPMRLFTLATLIPVALICAAATLGGLWILASLIYLTVLTACLDEIVHHVTPPTKDSEFPAAMVLSVSLGVLHFGLLALVVNALANGNSSIIAKIGIFIAAGFFFGQISNSNAHELIHRGGRRLHRLGKWVYISLLFGHHTSAHVLVHHRYVATPSDPSTSRSGESYYKFAARAWRGSFRKGLAAETERQRRVDAPTYRHPYVTYVGGAAGFVALAWSIGGPIGAAIYVALATFSTSQLLLSDYIQHYGLLWLPPMVQVVFDAVSIRDRVRSSIRPLSAACQKPLAGMVICGSGPNLTHELCCSAGSPGFPDPDLFDHFAHSGHRLLTPPSPTSDCSAQS